MAVKNRKSNSPNTTSSVIEKSKKSMRKAKKDMDNTSLITNKYGALLGLLIIFFGIIYLILFGRYIYKRSTGQTTSALKNENPLNVENLDMEAFKKAIKIDENGKITFTKEDLEKYKNVYVDVNGNAQIPPKEDENIEEIRNEEADDQSGANVKVEETAANESKLRQKRSLNMAGNNAPDEIGEMSDYLSNLLTSGPSANFVDLLRNKIVILNPFSSDNGAIQSTSFTSSHIRHRRSINQHIFASGSNNNIKKICHNMNPIEINICY